MAFYPDESIEILDEGLQVTAGAQSLDFVGSGVSVTAVGNAVTVTISGGGGAIGSAVTGGTEGSVLFVGAGGVLAQDNANFFWDDSNNRLGIGTATPSAPLHIVGASGLGQLIAAGTATTSVNALSITQTWNNSGVTFNGVLINITRTAAGGESNSFNVQAGGISLFRVNQTGATGGVVYITDGGSNGLVVGGGINLNINNASLVNLHTGAAKGLSGTKIASGYLAIRKDAAAATTGYVEIAQGTITTDVKLLDASVTWNNAAVAFTGLKANFTDTASAAGTLLMDLQVGGTSKFGVDKYGKVAQDATATITASTTQTQGQGALTAAINEVSTCANFGDTVTLPTAVEGLSVVVINNGAQTLKIFPASGDNLGKGVDTAMYLSAGASVMFRSYDTTNWRATGVRKTAVQKDVGTIATTGSTYSATQAPITGRLVAAYFNGDDALAANDTNYLTFYVTNQGQAGAGSTAMLAATDANTTKATGGTAIADTTNRSLTLNGTAANLELVAGDRILITFTATGTLANTVTNSMITLVFEE